MTKLRLAEILGKKIFEKSQLLEKFISPLRGEMTVNQGWKLCYFRRESAEVSLTNKTKSLQNLQTQADSQEDPRAFFVTFTRLRKPCSVLVDTRIFFFWGA